MYQNLISNAFGTDESVWRAASPASDAFSLSSWDGKLVSLVLCDADEYVPVDQFIVMEAKLQKSSWSQRHDAVLKISSVVGKHDDCWSQGFGMAECVEEVLDVVGQKQ
jgi:hypothetical protein